MPSTFGHTCDVPGSTCILSDRLISFWLRARAARRILRRLITGYQKNVFLENEVSFESVVLPCAVRGDEAYGRQVSTNEKITGERRRAGLRFRTTLLLVLCTVEYTLRYPLLSVSFLTLRFFCTSSHPPFPPCTLSLGNLAHSFARSYILLTNFIVSSLYRDFSSSARTRDFFLLRFFVRVCLRVSARVCVC